MFESLTERESDVLALLAEGLSNREIAQRLVLSPETVKWYNKQIYQKLGAGSRTEAAAVARRYGLLEGDGEEEEGARPEPDALPSPLTGFVGRQQELKEIGGLLRSKRLLTLTGPGGTGKTRLAVEVAAHARPAYEDGVYFVALARVEEAAEVAPAIVRALGLQEGGSKRAEEGGRPAKAKLASFLRRRQVLLILDNFEHVLEAAPLVAELLDAAPRLSVLATSREPLRLYGEQEYRVQPLPLPPAGETVAVETVAENEAVRLFLLRAQAVQPGFELIQENAATVAAICRRLEGLPLAIELAAVRLKLFAPANLLARLEDRLGTLTRGPRDLPARQQTLRATIDWSHELLTVAERILFRRLAIFRGGATLAAIEAICGEGLEVGALDVVATLLDKSLIWQQEDNTGDVRIGMLETIREYAREKLVAAGELEQLRAKHARYFLAWVQQAEADLRAGPDQYLWLGRVMADYDNVRAVLTSAFRTGQVELGAALVGALRNFWFRSGLYEEGTHWTERALAVVERVPPAVQAGVYSAAALMMWALHAHDRGRQYQEQALALYRELGDERNAAWTQIYVAGQWIGREGAYAAVATQAQEGVRLLREMGDRVGVAQGLNILGELARTDGRDEVARGYYEEALAIARETGDRLREILLLENLGFLALREEADEEAERLLREALETGLDLDSSFVTGYTFLALAGAYVRRAPARAACLIGAGERIMDELGAVPHPGDQAVFAQNRETVRERLGDDAWAAALARGRALTMAEAVAFAREEG